MIQKTFFVHYTKLHDRYHNILNQTAKYEDIKFIKNYEIINSYDQQEIDETIYNQIFDESEYSKNKKCIFVNRNGPEMTRNMQKAELSNALKHFECYQRISKSIFKDDDWFLVFEDDIIFKKTPLKILDSLNFAKSNYNDFGFIFCGEASLLKGNNSEFVYLKENPCTNGLCSYLINKKTASIIVDFVKDNKISFPFDHELNFIFYKNDIKVLWSTPVTIHGSINNMFEGTVER